MTLEQDARILIEVMRDGDYQRHNDLVTFLSDERNLWRILRTLIDMKELEMRMVEGELVYKVKP